MKDFFSPGGGKNRFEGNSYWINRWRSVNIFFQEDDYKTLNYSIILNDCEDEKCSTAKEIEVENSNRYMEILHGGAKIWILSSYGENNILQMTVANE